jgi:curved DNA-binding protein CbpA
VHDYFDILGVSRDARASDIRRACGRHSRPVHPDVWDGDRHRPAGLSRLATLDARLVLTGASDIAIDFVDAAQLVDRMRDAFFVESSS